MTTTNADVVMLTEGVLFDCDGVLVDSDASVVEAWSRWARKYELDPVAVADIVHGRRGADTVALLIAGERQSAALDDINAFEVESAGTVTAIPGAVVLVSAIDPAHWAVVTSGNRILARARLAAARVPTPAVVITADDVTDGKPHPEGYQAAARSLGLRPDQTVVLEDANSGVLAARAAGVSAVIGVGARALETDADVVVTDLDSISWTGGGLRIAAAGVLRRPTGMSSRPTVMGS